MNKQSENKVTSQDDQNKTNLERELTGDELNIVAGGTGKAAPKPPEPKETVTFEYGALQVQYVQQKPD